MGTIAGRLEDWAAMTEGDPGAAALVRRWDADRDLRDLADAKLRAVVVPLAAATGMLRRDKDFFWLEKVVFAIGQLTEESTARALRVCCLGLADELAKIGDLATSARPLAAEDLAELDDLLALLVEESARLVQRQPYPSVQLAAYVGRYWAQRSR